MPSRPLLLSCLAVGLVAVAGCREQAPPFATEEAMPPVPPAVPVAEPAAPSSSSSGALPAPGTITHAGFGPAAFGADEEQVRMAWGKALEGAPGEPGGCHVLVPAPRGDGPLRFGFMIEGGKLARIDVALPGVVAPGGGKIGMSTAQILALYPGAQSMPHKYVEGARTLRVANPGGSASALVFDTAADGTITAWRIGVPPQIDYVEGCG